MEGWEEDRLWERGMRCEYLSLRLRRSKQFCQRPMSKDKTVADGTDARAIDRVSARPLTVTQKRRPEPSLGNPEKIEEKSRATGETEGSASRHRRR